jgi:hypothetical protein
MSILAINRLALMQDFHSVSVVFPNSSKEYTYKSSFKCEVGDEVIICAPDDSMKIVEVVGVKPYAELPNADIITYKWLVQKVDRSGYDAIIKNEEGAVEHIESIRALARQEATKKALFTECAGSEQATALLHKFFTTPTAETETVEGELVDDDGLVEEEAV